MKKPQPHENRKEPKDPDARTLRMLLTWWGDDLSTFMDRPPPPAIRRFIQNADRPVLRGLLVEVLVALNHPPK